MGGELSKDQTFIKKLNSILKVNLENEHFGVNELAIEIGLSRSQLHRKLQSLEGISASKFIRQFRLGKAMEMLQDDVATASEIAYRVGFSSPTYFNTCFRIYYGYPPGEVKHRNYKSDKKKDQKPSVKSKIFKKNKKKKNFFNKRMVLINSFGILLLAILFYSYNQKSNKKNVLINSDTNSTNKSIAVLPFKNLSDNKDNQYFADGMREDIINHLSKIQDITVKSRQSSDWYGSGKMSGSEIAESLGVNYIIDGSVQKYDDRVKIIVHLIDAKNDENLWSKDFDHEFNNIFKLEREISTDIASELNLVLSPTELQQIGKIPTEHVEAYNLYLKGHHFLTTFSGESFQLAEKYFKESIKIDPDFALPYSGLAEYYLYRAWPRIPEADYLKAKEYAFKAISLDYSLAETHRVLGTIFMEYEWNWAAAEEEFKKAIELDSKNPNANINYAKYLMYIKGDFNLSREYINKALLLAPVSYYFYATSAECYLMAGNYSLALKEANEAKEINSDILWAPWIIFVVNVKQQKDDIAVNELARSWNIDPKNIKNTELMLAAYKKEGIKGVFRWINKLDVNLAHNDENKLTNAYFIAQKFAFLGERDNVMKWLNIAYDRKNGELFRVKFDYFFNDMRTHPEFLLLLKKMNLGNFEGSTFLK